MNLVNGSSHHIAAPSSAAWVRQRREEITGNSKNPQGRNHTTGAQPGTSHAPGRAATHTQSHNHAGHHDRPEPLRPHHGPTSPVPPPPQSTSDSPPHHLGVPDTHTTHRERGQAQQWTLTRRKRQNHHRGTQPTLRDPALDTRAGPQPAPLSNYSEHIDSGRPGETTDSGMLSGDGPGNAAPTRARPHPPRRHERVRISTTNPWPLL